MSNAKSATDVKRNSTFRRSLFYISYLVSGKSTALVRYGEFMRTQYWPYERLRLMQETQLGNMVRYAYQHVPYYRHLFDSIGLKPSDISGLRDLQKVPVLTKQIIRSHRAQMLSSELKALRYVCSSTGGSTGEPLRYVLSDEDAARGVALLYRGWSYGGYCPGDRIAIIAGASLIPTGQSMLRKHLMSLLRNVRYYSSYGMSDETMIDYVRSLNHFKPQFLRGYVSSIYMLACFIRDKGLPVKFRPRAIFTTSEKLLESQRRVMEEIFGTKVFDNYGLNDGGVSAYECERHDGMHIDMERAILEVVDENGQQVIDRPGRILATSLYNFAFPFIRYDTGDIGVMSYSKCGCGRELPLLKQLVGRTTDVLVVNGKRIGSPVLTVLFGKLDIEQYQIVQESDSRILCRIVKGREYDHDDEEFIRRSLVSHLGPVDIVFDYVPSITPAGGQKHKFILNLSQSREQNL